MMKNSTKIIPSSCTSLPDLNIDIEAQVDLDVGPIYNLSKKGNIPERDSTNERVDLLLRESTDRVLTYNLFLQFTSSSILLNNVSQEYYYFRHATVIWQCEYIFAAVALGYYLVVGNIEEMFFLEKTNIVFLLSFLCVILSSIFAILSRLVVGGKDLTSFNEIEVKWLFRYLGMIVTRVQLCEFLVFFFSVLSANLMLLAKVLGGKCPPQSELRPFNLWYLQYCNTMVEHHGLPTVPLLWVLIITVTLQLFFRGCSPNILVMCWSMTIIFMFICLYLVQGQSYWIFTAFFIAFIISYRIEHMNIMHFAQVKAYLIQTKVARDAIESGERLKLANSDLELKLANKRVCQGENELKAKCLMVRHISHELRNPLNTTSIGLEVLEHELSILGKVIDPSILELVGAIRKAGGNALVIVNELLTYEKLAAGLHTLELAPAAILAFVKEMVEEFKIPAEAKEIDLEITQDSDKALWANFDRVRMALVLRNFLSNAVKFTPNGGTIGVNISVTKADTYTDKRSDNSDSVGARAVDIHGRVMISVKDSGAGLTKENVKHLFQEGVQFNANTLQAGGGSGFGLYIAKGIMDLHPGGNIWATSDGEGLGCEFNIDLPLITRELLVGLDNNPLVISNDVSSIRLVNTSLRSNRTERLRSETSFKATDVSTVNITPRLPLRVLVVDDSQANRKMLSRMLKICGHTSTEAGDGLEAVKEIALMMRKRELRKESDRKESFVYTQYDVVLMDSCMPRMDGPQAAIQMREMGFMGPIIGITGNSVSDFSEFQFAGVDLVLSKPINKVDLVAALETTLGPKKNDVAKSIKLQTVSIDVNERDFRYHSTKEISGTTKFSGILSDNLI